MQFESNRAVSGNFSPFCRASDSCVSASLADRNLNKINNYVNPAIPARTHPPPTPHPCKPSATLLIHLRSRRHSIHRHEEQLLRFDRPEQSVDVVENVRENLLLGDAKLDVRVVRMRAIVNDSVHVQVQVIELGNLCAGN